MRDRDRTLSAMGIGFFIVATLITGAIAAGIWLVPFLFASG